jgi:hypothetical protein
LIVEAAARDPYPDQGPPGLHHAYRARPRGAGTWLFSHGEDAHADYQATIELRAGGRMTYWQSPTIAMRPSGSSRAPFLLEQSVTRAVHQLVRTAAWFYGKAGYVGAVDLGVVLEGIREAQAISATSGLGAAPAYGAPEYRVVERVSIAEITNEPRAVTTRLLGPLYEAVSVRNYQPFDNALPEA